MIKTALISVSDKSKVVDFARQIRNLGIRIISTGNTAGILTKNSIDATLVSDVTKFQEMLSGRLKSIHPNIFAGILADRKNKKHVKELKDLGIGLIDMVVVNFYPFESAPTVENIDIGGQSLLRAAAKNYENVLAVCDPRDYEIVIKKLKEGKISSDDRLRFAAKAFSHTARYDSIINNHFNFLAKNEYPSMLNLTFDKIQDLRYGENPYQTASFYRDAFIGQSCVSDSRQLQGKELSFNNILDVDAAFELVKEFEKPAAVVVKHTNPSGAALSSTIEDAYKKAHQTDPKSAFGSIVALNRKCNLETAKLIAPLFIEVVICPGFDKDALQVLSEKKSLRLLEAKDIKSGGQSEKLSAGRISYELKKVAGGLLVQNSKFPDISEKNFKVVSKRKPTRYEIDAMSFALKVNKHVKSNSVVLAKQDVTVGIGAGQMSRVDAVKLAVMKSEKKGKGSVMSSDAFFPFRDGVDEAAKAGVTAIIQPGGSIRDKEVIDAANEHRMAMVFTGVRLFRH